MYIHLGGRTVIKQREIIGIFDLDYCSVSKRTRMFLRASTKAGRVVNVTDDLPKSFIVCRNKEGEDKVYIAQISSTTLHKRTGYVESISKF